MLMTKVLLSKISPYAFSILSIPRWVGVAKRKTVSAFAAEWVYFLFGMLHDVWPFLLLRTALTQGAGDDGFRDIKQKESSVGLTYATGGLQTFQGQG